MPKDLLLALDQGTTSSRALLFDRAGRRIATAQQEFAQHYPRPGWVEHDPADLWRTQRDTARAVLERADVTVDDLAAVGLTNQRETTLLWDRATGQPVHPAIVWQDRRTAALCDALRAEGFDATIRATTGLVTDPYFSATKLAWLLDHVPGARERAADGALAFGTVDTWLAWNLSGGALHITDVSNASRTMLYDIHRHTWSAPICDRLGIPQAVLPRVVPSSGVVGMIHADVLGAEVPLAGIAGDQQAATFGQVCFAPGMAKNTYGTGSFLLMNTGPTPISSSHGLLTTLAWQLGAAAPQYALEGSIFVTGAAVQWLRDEMGLVSSSAESAAIAASVPDSAGVVVVPAFTGLGAPYWDAYARGTILGLTRGTGRAHIVRATLESIAFQTRDVLDAMRADSGHDVPTLRVDGGAAANDVLMQMVADALGTPVERPRIVETTALGAATLAGLGVDVWDGPEALVRQWALDRRFEPTQSADAREAAYARWRRAVERSRAWATDDTGA